jgi:hypothetical protein
VDFFAHLWYFSAIAALLSKRVLIPDSIRVRAESLYFSSSDFNYRRDNFDRDRPGARLLTSVRISVWVKAKASRSEHLHR